MCQPQTATFFAFHAPPASPSDHRFGLGGCRERSASERGRLRWMLDMKSLPASGLNIALRERWVEGVDVYITDNRVPTQQGQLLACLSDDDRSIVLQKCMLSSLLSQSSKWSSLQAFVAPYRPAACWDTYPAFSFLDMCLAASRDRCSLLLGSALPHVNTITVHAGLDTDLAAGVPDCPLRVVSACLTDSSALLCHCL